ncbi:MAG: hypothetical protein RMK01_11520 [Thermomicrobium sp.]|nr:hypothetical protein [Thermomicrobium sp.]MDW8060691.1 hypothetical protein [Thermomicrobium sp.]
MRSGGNSRTGASGRRLAGSLLGPVPVARCVAEAILDRIAVHAALGEFAASLEVVPLAFLVTRFESVFACGDRWPLVAEDSGPLFLLPFGR